MRLSTTLALLLPALLLPTAPLAGAEPKRVVLARAELPSVAPLAAPALAFPGGLGIPRVITWADTTGASGIAWGSTAQIAAANASITYNATNGVWNVPTGKGFSFTINNVSGMSFAADTLTVGATIGAATFTGNGTIGRLGNSAFYAFTGGSARQAAVSSTATDGASAVAVTLGPTSLYSTAGAKLVSIGSTLGGTYVENLAIDLSGAILLTNNTSTLPAGTNAYLQYNGTSGIFNVPATKNVTFTVNAVRSTYVDTTGVHVDLSALAAGSGFMAQDATVGPALVYSSDGNTGAELIGKHADGAAAIAVKLNTSATYANATAKIVSVQNNGTERLSINLSGAILLTNNASTAPAASEAYLQYNGTNGEWNVPTGKGFRFAVNNSGVATFTTTTIGFNGLQVDSAVTANLTSVTGQIDVAHLANGSGAPTSPTAGSGCGTSSAPAVTGGSISGKISVTCGTAGTSGNNFVSATFPVAFNSTPNCVISCANAATCAGEVLSDHMANPTASTIAVSCAGGTCTTGSLAWYYFCSQ